MNSGERIANHGFSRSGLVIERILLARNYEIKGLHHRYTTSGEGQAAVALLAPRPESPLKRFFLLEPYDPNKVPILMIHGLMSSPLTWKELTNELLADPYVRTHYQIWHYVYPTGQSLFYTAKGLRDSLDA